MMDVTAWAVVVEVLSTIDHSRRPDDQSCDVFGHTHVLLFGDFKQLPPATSQPPFIVSPEVWKTFDFRVLRQNRRVTADEARKDELEDFHEVLSDISWGRATRRVEEFIIAAYIRGAACGSAQKAELEGSTSVFTKRRFRDRNLSALII